MPELTPLSAELGGSLDANRSVAAPRPKRRERELREHVQAGAENRPGVYRIYGPGDELIYVGKSVRVRTRLLSYFRAPEGEKAAEIAGHAQRIAWEYVPSEFAALLRELRLIRQHRPRYNIEHKSERGLCFVELTREPAPRFLARARPTPGRLSCWGPIRGRARAAAALRDLTDLFGLRDCAATTPMRFADQPDLFTQARHPLCWRGEIGRCVAPCAGGCTETEYRARLLRACRFLAGQDDGPLEALRGRIAQAAERLEFEYAARLRDRLERLERLRRDVAAARDDLDGLSFVYRVRGWRGETRLYLVRRGLVVAECQRPRGRTQRRELRRRVARVFAAPRTPLERLQADAVAEMLLVARWFRDHPEERRSAVPAERLLDRARPGRGA